MHALATFRGEDINRAVNVGSLIAEGNFNAHCAAHHFSCWHGFAAEVKIPNAVIGNGAGQFAL